jgi:hypothetical protein
MDGFQPKNYGGSLGHVTSVAKRDKMIKLGPAHSLVKPAPR